MSSSPDQFKRIAQTVRLSRGQLALVLVSGPRLRAEEGLKLIRSQLPRERYTLWHRLDKGELDLAGVVARSGQPEPIVLAHGLDYVAASDLPHLESRLNLLRDRLAALDAAIILWIPSDSLSDFQRYCPDLFHWRSILATLTNEDLAVASNILLAPLPVTSPYDPRHRGFFVPYPKKGSGVIGRADALRRLRETLAGTRRSPNRRSVAVVGLAGLGKTQLVVEYAHDFEQEYPGGVYWLTADQDLDSQLVRLAEEVMWAPPLADPASKIALATHQLRTRSGTLLIFDNVEHLDQIQSLLPEPAAQVDVLATSRTPLETFRTHDIGELDLEAGVQLLASVSERVLATAEQRSEARNIVETLDRLPLALELAGGFLKQRPDFSLATYAQQLQDKGVGARGLGDTTAPTPHTRHSPNLRAALHVDEQLLKGEPLLRDVLDVLAWSAPSAMGLDLLAHMLGQTSNLEDLKKAIEFGVGLHLLRWEQRVGETGQSAVRMHRLVQAVHREDTPLLQDAPRTDRILERLGKWFEDRREQFSQLPQFEAEIDHLVTWREHAVSTGRRQAEARLWWLNAYPAFHHGQYHDSLALLERAWKSFETAGVSALVLEAHIQADLGVIWSKLGFPKKAKEFAERALKLRLDTLGPLHPDTATSYSSVGIDYRGLGDDRKALQYELRALEIRRRVLGPRHPHTAASLNGIGISYRKLGELRKALEYELQALEIRREVLGPRDLATAASLNDVGLSYRELGNLRKALEYAQQADEICREVLGPRHPDTTSALDNVGGAYGALNDHPKALEYALQALENRREIFGPRHPATATSLNNVGATYAKLGDRQKASEYLNQALEIRQAVLGNDHPDTIAVRRRIATMLNDFGNPKEAIRVLDEGIRLTTNAEQRERLIQARNQLRQAPRKGYRTPPQQNKRRK